MNDRQCSDYANAGKSGGVNMQGGGGMSYRNKPSKAKTSKSSPKKPMKPMESTKGNY